jgi:hypothetical protein
VPGKESLEIVGIDTVPVNGRVKAAGTMRCGADVPNGDIVRDQCLDPGGIGKHGCSTKKVAHDLPEHISGVGVILLAPERFHSRQASEDQHARGRSRNRRKTDRLW